MKLTIKIVESINRYEEALHEKIRKGQLRKPEVGLVMTPETFNKVFSPERIKLLQRIQRNHVHNIYQLAKEMGKPYEVVFRNIKYLEGLGLVKIKEKNKKMIPSLAHAFSIDLFSGAEASS